jgi:hypothetical protein
MGTNRGCENSVYHYLSRDLAELGNWYACIYVAVVIITIMTTLQPSDLNLLEFYIKRAS